MLLRCLFNLKYKWNHRPIQLDSVWCLWLVFHCLKSLVESLSWLEHCKFVKGQRQERKGDGVALFAKECFDVDELNAGNDNVKSLWVSISGKDNILVEVCYRLTNHHEETDNHSTSIWQKLAQTTSLVLVVDFNFPDIHRKYKTAERKQTRRFLGCVEDNFLK